MGWLSMMDSTNGMKSWELGMGGCVSSEYEEAFMNDT